MAGRRSPISTYNFNRNKAARNIYEEFARRLERRMLELGIPGQSALARRCNALLPKPEPGQKQRLTFGRDLINRYYRGMTLPRTDALHILAKALECEESDLIPAAVPSAATGRPGWEKREFDDGRVSIAINRIVSRSVANKLISVLREYDKTL